MSDTSDRNPGPREEPDAGVAPGGTDADTGDSGRAANAEVVLDQDSEPDEPERDIREQVDRAERHNRGRDPGDDPSDDSAR
jgi:hypothetical protein